MPILTPEERTQAEAQIHEVQAKDRQKYDELRRHAHATYRAVEGRQTWDVVGFFRLRGSARTSVSGSKRGVRVPS